MTRASLMRAFIIRASLGVAALVWLTFLACLAVALLFKERAPLRVYGTFSVIVHLAGIFMLPPLALITAFAARSARWIAVGSAAGYLLATLFLYPRLVERYLAAHPGSPGWHWTAGTWCDYQYVAVHPEGDPQWAGQVSLFPPYFQFPSSEQP